MAGSIRSKRVIEVISRLVTERQLEVLRLMASGAPNKLICRELGLAERTVKTHITAILRAPNVTSRTQAALTATKLGILEVGQVR